MSAPLTIVIRGFKQAPEGISIYWHWGAETNEIIRFAVKDTKEAIAGLSPDSDIPTILKAILNHQNGGAGLATHFTWWHCWYDDDRTLVEDKAAYEAEIGIIQEMIEKHGIPEVKDRNAGAIAFTPGLAHRMSYHCDWAEYIDIKEDYVVKNA
jgi:hypothetical protein